MGISIRGYDFEGPFNTPDSLHHCAGVFVVLCKHERGWRILDVDEAESIRQSVARHYRAGCWAKNCPTGPFFAVHYPRDLTRIGREVVARSIRRKYPRMPCGGD